MSITDPGHVLARSVAIAILTPKPAPSREDLETAADLAITTATAAGHTVDRALLVKHLQSEVRVFVGEGDVLSDTSDHVDWLDSRRPDIDWAFWRAYRAWTATTLPGPVVSSLDRLTDEVLGLLEDPKREGRWDRRGMVVGQVQSGKTGNYTGLICKAADAGYRFIVVLAGLHNSLRSQTQQRIDEGFLGIDSRTSKAFDDTNRAIGVGDAPVKHPVANTLTSSDENGDFSKAIAGRFGQIGNDPMVLVVKKHRDILDNLIAWVTERNGELNPETGRRTVRDLPLLVIDDEADNASVNTARFDAERDEDTEPKAINRRIRTLLSSFDKSALVSYTATPFANIFIGEDKGEGTEWGEDLFPRSFILRMPAPSNYLGPGEVFGVSSDDDPDGVRREGLPVVRTVDDTEAWVPSPHKPDLVPGPVPTSVKEAIRAFILACAARAARGQVDVHNSMLVHVTRFVDVQKRIAEQIQQVVDAIREDLLYAGGDGDERRRLRDLWQADHAKTLREFPTERRGDPIGWIDVEKQLNAAVGGIRVAEINGKAGDALAYIDHPTGATVIAVGGDKLSRGLTLEGLTVSYYLRPSRMYDTLMQMGRWFGYRPGYADLMRLYTTGDLQHWYREISSANLELGQKFEDMAAAGSNPENFSLYVRKSAAGLLVTAQAKMQGVREMKVTFSGDSQETISFERRPGLHEKNRKQLERLVTEASRSGRARARENDRQNHVWDDVPGSDVASFLEGFSTIDRATKANAPLLARYVRARIKDDELLRWTVALVHNSTSDELHTVAGNIVGLTKRGQLKSVDPSLAYSIRRLGSPLDEAIDLSDQEFERAKAWAIDRHAKGHSRSKEPPTTATALSAREVRPMTRGLLVLYLLDPAATAIDGDETKAPVPSIGVPIPGFLISFPHSPNAPTVNYMVPERYWEKELA